MGDLTWTQWVRPPAPQLFNTLCGGLEQDMGCVIAGHGILWRTVENFQEHQGQMDLVEENKSEACDANHA